MRCDVVVVCELNVYADVVKRTRAVFDYPSSVLCLSVIHEYLV